MDPDGVFEWYRSLIALRASFPVVTQGRFELLLPRHPSIMAYLRADAKTRLLVLGNYDGNAVTLPRKSIPDGPWTSLLTNLPGAAGGDLPPMLPPYFAGVWKG